MNITERFLKYVSFHTTADENSKKTQHPSFDSNAHFLLRTEINGECSQRFTNIFSNVLQ